LELVNPIDFIILKATIPDWLTVSPLLGRVLPSQTLNLTIDFKNDGLIDKNQNTEGLIVIQYVQGILGSVGVSSATLNAYALEQQTTLSIENVIYNADKLLVPVAYEVYHEV
jgi:hypothetical protein